MPVSDDPADQARLHELVGHPGDKEKALYAQIQDGVVRRFRDIQKEFLDVIWTLDKYRIEQVVPARMGNVKDGPEKRLGGVYRGKGNIFSNVLSLILGNKTTSQLASRGSVQGFSQSHQIDIAWPSRDSKPLVDPLVCAEAKLTGAPPHPGNPKGRGATDDWSNRRKELKFQATDLKLYRHVAESSRIEHWDIWRRSSPPHVYSLWAARIAKSAEIEKMIDEARILTETYSDGVGIFAFQVNSSGDGYEQSPLPKKASSRVTRLDSVLDMIQGQIRTIMDASGNQVPKPLIAEVPDTSE